MTRSDKTEVHAEETPGSGEVSLVIEHLFRHEAGRMVSILTGIFGPEHLTLAEDVVQEALARALQTWPYYGMPDNPAAWIMRTSRNLALDTIRRQNVFREKEPEIIRLMEASERPSDDPALRGGEIADDRLRMMFVCCHPLIPPEAQVALALKVLCGFSIPEISRAFLTTEASIAKRLTRAKQKIREAGIPFEIPAGPDLARRLDGVLHSLYLLFNEGYKASEGEKLVRREVCEEAIRLATLLAGHPPTDQPKTHALLALMLLNTARTPTRTDENGDLLRLKDQNRARWDRSMMARGLFHWACSASGSEITRYHLEAGIAACHCTAPDYASTDWRRILSLYDRLVEIDSSPVVALNRAVALAEVKGPEAALESIANMENLRSLENYHLLHAVLGEFESRLNHPRAAAGHFQKSLGLTTVRTEQTFLRKRLDDCEQEANIDGGKPSRA
jgi:RNA polymerase sigma-70 factor (ECF subfamily)